MRRNGSGSGNTYAGRSKKTTSSVRTAKATASDAPTQPITEPARAVGLDREEVRAGARGRRDQQPDRQRDQEPTAADARLRHRPGAGRDEQRHEHTERDQLAEREMDDAREPEDERVPDGDEAVHGARREPAREDLQGDGHDGTLGLCA